MNKEVAIIGVNGKMGKWFADYFHKMGFEVKGFDTNDEIKEKFIIKAKSSSGCYITNGLCSFMHTYKKYP